MKIVFCIHQFLPDFSSGTELLTYETAKQFRQRGHEVRVFTGFPVSAPLKDENRFDRYIYEGIAVERFNHAHVPMGGQSNVIELHYDNNLFREYFREYLLREKPNIVHFYHFARLSTSGIEVCEELGIPTVFTPTDFWYICPLGQLLLPNNSFCDGPDEHGGNCLKHLMVFNKSQKSKLLIQLLPGWLFDMAMKFIGLKWNLDKKYSLQLRSLANRPNTVRDKINKVGRIIAPSQMMEKMLIENRFDKNKIIVLPFGLDLKYFFPRIRGKSMDMLRVGYIGTLSEHKGAHVLLNAIRQMKDVQIEVVLYGKLSQQADYSRHLIDLAGENQRVKFLGTFPNHDIGRVLDGLDVLIIPSIWRENTPLVLYSAQAAKCPVVASDVGGISEVITDGVNGILFEAGNSEQLKKILLALVHDRNILRSLSERSSTPLAIEGYIDRLADIYFSLCEEKL